jgi:RNA polymerase sigma-B factor
MALGGESTDGAEVERQVIEYARSGDPALRAELVVAHQWLVMTCVRRMRRRREPIEDLVQVCNVGLLEALDRFDPSFGVTFRTYASATLYGVLRHHYRTTWRVRMPRAVQELHLRVRRAIDTLSGELQRSPTVAEVATLTGVSIHDVVQAIEAGANFWPVSLSDTGGGSDIDVVQSGDHLHAVEQRADVLALLARLPDVQRTVLYLRYFEERTQKQIGEIVGVSQATVSRIMRHALAEIRRYGDPSDIDYDADVSPAHGLTNGTPGQEG